MLQAKLGLASMAVTTVGEIGRAEEAQDIYVVPVDVGWAYESAWTIHRHDRVLSTIKLSTLVNL